MTTSRIRATEFVKLLNAVPQPVYVLDDEFTLVFCNRACCEWLGQEASSLLGSQCRYQSSSDPSHAGTTLEGICPPPTVLEGHAAVNAVSRVCNQTRHYRQATFLPLGTPDERPFAVVAIVSNTDQPSPRPPAPAPAEDATAVILHEQLQRLRDEAAWHYCVDRLVGRSPAMRRARRQAKMAAASRASVLLVGPSGSGRQHLASAIHHASATHAMGALIPLACSVLDPDLIRSTISALAGGENLGDDAQHSSLLLNDADRLPLDVQAELDHMFENRFPLRIIATAQQPLEELVDQGKYRADLAATLTTVLITLPPLAERREDIPLLAQMFLENANTNSPRQFAGFTPEALDLLDQYHWPGNADELAQVVAEARQQADGVEIGPDDLPEKIHVASKNALRPRRPEQSIVLNDFLAQIERELIQRALARAKGNKAKAARLLGLTRPRLYRRLVQLGLAEEDDIST